MLKWLDQDHMNKVLVIAKIDIEVTLTVPLIVYVQSGLNIELDIWDLLTLKTDDLVLKRVALVLKKVVLAKGGLNSK